MARRLWETAVPITSTPAAIYLLWRGVGLPAEVLQGTVLRYHSACPFRLENGSTVKLPAMLGAIVDIRTNEFCGIHRTALKPDGSGKADYPGLGSPKRMLGNVSGACIKLSADDEVTFGLHVAEGIETALSCKVMGFRPIWAALSAGGIARFPVLSGIETVTIMADNDASGTGLSAARDCARRWVAAGREAIVLARSEAGRDWADPIGRGG
ncbi:toprim domain-containing protein [Chelativorans sp.]|uniref:DUF7146 domain-containing protein n=1 Tax=Chelativorans sp. TaxID=2203393 RepID=UPI002811361E|nr:toprim domain-containing protein [Chelativorans sp.]